jgi:hypothetical protein
VAKLAFDVFRLAGSVVLNAANAISGLRNVRTSSDRTSNSMEELTRRFWQNERRLQGFGDEAEETEDDLQGLRHEMDRVSNNSMTFSKRLQSLGNGMKSVGNGVKSAGYFMSTFITAPILAGIAGAIKQASDMNETISKTQVVFGQASKEVLKWSDQTLKSVGLAKGTALDMAATFGDMGTAMGLNNNKAKEMAMNLVNLTGDMASFKNMKPEEIHIALTGAYTGETEALKRLGIVMTVANLERFASARGIKKEYDEMTQAEKIQLRYNYIMNASKNSVGDFKRTQQSAANQMRIFTEGIKESGAKIGTIFLPYFTKAIQFVNKLMDRFHNLSPAMQKVILIVALVAAGIGPLLVVIGTAITVIGGLVAAIGTIGLPVAAAIAAIIPIIAVLGGFIATIATAAYKTGILQKALDFLKNMFDAVKNIIQGNLSTALDILMQKMGLSSGQAAIFTQKVVQARNAIKKVIDVIKNVGSLIKAMFDEDKQKVIDLLVKKFKFSKNEAQNFWIKMKILKDEILKFANILKNDGVKALTIFAEYIKRGAKFVVDHRKEIAKAISLIISFAATVVIQAKNAYNAAKWLVKFALKVKSAMDDAKRAVVRALGKMVSDVNSIGSKMWTAGYNAIKALGRGIEAAFWFLRDKASKAASIIADFLGFRSPTKEGPGSTADKWGPNMITMLSKTMLAKKSLLRSAMEEISGEMDLSTKIKNLGISASNNLGAGTSGKPKLILQILNPKFFNQQDVSKMMQPVINRLEFMGFGSR